MPHREVRFYPLDGRAAYGISLERCHSDARLRQCGV